MSVQLSAEAEEVMEFRESEACSVQVHRRRRNRTVFSSEAIAVMEEQFGQNRYPDIHRREMLAESLGIPEARVQVWFQNRRARRNKRMTDGSQQKRKCGEPEDANGPGPVVKKRRLSTDGRTALKKESPLSRPPSPLYDHQQKLQLQYDRLFAYFNTPYIAFSPPPQCSPPHDFVRRILSPPWLPQLTAHPGNDVSVATKSGDNFVDRMFRFSVPAKQNNIYEVDHEKVAYRMMFPPMNNTMYSMTSFPITRGFSMDSLLMRAPRMSDARDSLDTDNSESD